MKKKTDKNRLDRYPRHLLGPAQNKHGGHQTQRERGFRGNTYGAASTCRSFTKEEREAWGAANGYPEK